jgi:1,4-alpha-glucan branching enzyme
MVQKRNALNKNLSTRKKVSKKSSVEFTFFAPDARDVYLIGEFNDWDIHSLPMKKENEKDWKATIELIPGRYEYKYFVDGSWVGEVPGVEKIPNAFGTQNLVIYVE